MIENETLTKDVNDNSKMICNAANMTAKQKYKDCRFVSSMTIVFVLNLIDISLYIIQRKCCFFKKVAPIPYKSRVSEIF